MTAMQLQRVSQPQTRLKHVYVSIETMSYSGATLLSFLLGAHPQIATIGELNGLIASEDPDVYLCSCGQKIKQCTFWRDVGEAMHAHGHEFDVARFNTMFRLSGPRWLQMLRMGSFRNPTLDRLRDALFGLWPAERRQLRALVARNQALIESILQVTGKSVFVDSSKDRLRLNALRRMSTLDVYGIHLLRDVRGVVTSQLRRNARIDAREGARRWVRLHQRLQTSLNAQLGSKYLRVRYEDLCRDPSGTLRRLYAFCGADPDVVIDDFRAAPHHIVGNPMRLNHLSEIRLDERWRTFLTSKQLQEIEQVAGAFSLRYGYR